MVKIRLQKLGRRNRSYFRIVATDARTKRQGMYLENLGTYDPIEKVAEKAVVVNTERVKHWVGQGAQATDAVVSLLRKRGVQFLNKPMKPKKKKKTEAKAAPKAKK